MKTNLRQQVSLINQIENELSKPRRVILLREWLIENGYEKVGECTHPTLYRATSTCTSCGTKVEAASLGDMSSEEALVSFRARLGAPE